MWIPIYKIFCYPRPLRLAPFSCLLACMPSCLDALQSGKVKGKSKGWLPPSLFEKKARKTGVWWIGKRKEKRQLVTSEGSFFDFTCCYLSRFFFLFTFLLYFSLGIVVFFNPSLYFFTLFAFKPWLLGFCRSRHTPPLPPFALADCVLFFIKLGSNLLDLVLWLLKWW